jgi:pimeloyl-ACP methyl ester carboxylesterase
MVVEINGVALHYETVGDGEPLLWLHGFMGAGADWKHIFHEPPDGFRLLAPDLRGHGASTNPSGEFSFRQAADDVGALLHHLGLEKVHAIGVSGGGIVLLHMATAAPSRIASMAIVSAPPYFPAQARALQRQMSESMFATLRWR